MKSILFGGLAVITYLLMLVWSIIGLALYVLSILTAFDYWGLFGAMAAAVVVPVAQIFVFAFLWMDIGFANFYSLLFVATVAPGILFVIGIVSFELIKMIVESINRRRAYY